MMEQNQVRWLQDEYRRLQGAQLTGKGNSQSPKRLRFSQVEAPPVVSKGNRRRRDPKEEGSQMPIGTQDKPTQRSMPIRKRFEFYSASVPLSLTGTSSRPLRGPFVRLTSDPHSIRIGFS